MKGSLAKFQFVCFIFQWIFLETFCRGVKREGVKSKYDLPSDLPMDAKQHAWTTVKENTDAKCQTPYYCWTCIICSLVVIGTICVVYMS